MSTLSPHETERRGRQRQESRRRSKEAHHARPDKQKLLYPAPSNEVRPLVVRVKTARLMLANMGHRKFWEEAARGEFEIIGHERLRLVTVQSLEDYIQRQPRAVYSRKPEPKGNAANL
jgi:hypothetical protein